MKPSKDMEDKVLSAVRDLARSITSCSVVVADISSLVEATSKLPLGNFDRWERLIRNEFSMSLGYKSPSILARFLTWPDLISWDGYEREKALRTISGGAPNAFFFSLAIRRLNDWVPQVRAAAREALPLIAEKTNPQDVLDALIVALSSWNSWGRIQESDKQTLLGLVSGGEMIDALKSRLILSTSGPMASLLTQLGRKSVLDEYLEEIAEKAIQPSVRAKAYRCMFERRMVWVEGRKWEWTDIRYCKGKLKNLFSERKLEIATSFIDLLNKAAIDRSFIVRRVAAEFLIRDLEKLGDKAFMFAERFASDKSNPVSERGLFALKRLRKINPEVK